MGIKSNSATIDLSNQGLDQIPSEIFTYSNLQKLILRNNNIRVIPKEVAALKRLKMIDLSYNKINVLYAKLFSLKTLEEIYLNNSNIKTIPSQISKLKHLRKISISGNYLKSLPGEFSLLTDLEFLNISTNPFEDFPKEILNLSQLKHLRLSNINFKSFPTAGINKELGNLTNLYCYSTHIQKVKTPETNRDYLFLATFKGNCLQRLKSLQEISPSMTKSSVPVKPLSVSKITKNIKRPRSTIVPEKISLSRNLIFICYSHKDEKWRNEVEESIKSMQLEGIELDYWSDQRLRTSEVWQDEIFRILSKSKIAILLVSKSFLASEFIQKQELPRILEKAKGDELRVMSIIINYCRFEENKRLSKYHSLNPPNTPLVSMGEDKQGYFLYKLTKDIESFIHPESF